MRLSLDAKRIQENYNMQLSGANQIMVVRNTNQFQGMTVCHSLNELAFKCLTDSDTEYARGPI